MTKPAGIGGILRQDLPEIWQGAEIVGTTLLIECQDAAMIATHGETAGFCVRASDRQLFVPLQHEEEFRALITFCVSI